MRDEKISFRQFAVAAAVASISPVSRLLPEMAVEIAGQSAWLAPLIGVIPVLLVAFAAKALLSGTENGLCGAMETALGKVLGRAAALAVALWIVVYGGFVLRGGAERLLSTVYPTGKMWFFLATMTGVALVAALGRVKSVSRTAELCVIILAVTLAAIFAFSLPDIKLRYLLPVEPGKSRQIGLSVLPVINASTVWVFLLFLGGYIRPGSYSRKTLVNWVLCLMGVILLIVITTIGVLGPEITKSQQYPFFIMISNLNILNIIERIEPVVIMIWIITDFILVALLMMASAEAFVKVLGLRKRYPFVLLSAAGMLLASFLISKDAFGFAKLSDWLVPAVNLAFSVLFLPFLMLIKTIKKKA